MQALKHVRHGIGTVCPYVHGHLSFVGDAKAKRCLRRDRIGRPEFSAKPFHLEARIGDSVIVLEPGDPPCPMGTAGSIYVYAPDVDLSYDTALERGAVSVPSPEDQPYLERNAGVRDGFGSTWWIWTYRGA